MAVNFEGSVVHLRDKLQEIDRKKTQNETSQKTESAKRSEKNDESEKQYVTDVIGVRNENRLAAVSSGSIQSEEEAFDMLEELKKQFASDSDSALNAHKKANPDAVMQFYPFE